MTLRRRLQCLEAAAKLRQASKTVSVGLGDAAMLPEVEAALRAALPGPDFEARVRGFAERVSCGGIGAEDAAMLARFPIGSVPAATLLDAYVGLLDFYPAK